MHLQTSTNIELYSQTSTLGLKTADNGGLTVTVRLSVALADFFLRPLLLYFPLLVTVSLLYLNLTRTLIESINNVIIIVMLFMF